jgi:hypothetical protein
MKTPITQFPQSGDVSIAYQVLGQGSIDLIIVPGWISHLNPHEKIPPTPAFSKGWPLSPGLSSLTNAVQVSLTGSWV